MAKANDWIVAGLNNPDFTVKDFSNIADMTVDNTQLLSEDEYLKSNFIKNNDAFKDENGKFSKSKFDTFYKKKVSEFGEFQKGDYYKGPALDMFDIDRTNETPVVDVHFSVKRGYNPDRQAIGIEGVNIVSDPELSRREIAENSKVFNYSTGKYENYSPNDHALFEQPLEFLKDMFTKDPLVLATWDNDGTHIDPVTGETMEHKKGDPKLNNEGTYYYETLGGRSPLGKDVLAATDVLTVDGKGLNKYDFFDSDDLEKSIPGTIAKSIAAVAPLFMGPAGTVYSTALIGREMAKSLPMLYGMVTAFSDSETPSWMNTIAAKAQAGTTSTSDYAQQNAFSFENFGNLMADVAVQWGQQKVIANTFNKLKKAGPEAIREAQENAANLYMAKAAELGPSEELRQACINKFMPEAEKIAAKSGQLGRDLSLAYMAIISNTDVYQDMLDHGASKLDAAAVALGSTLGMYKFDKTGIGELFFDDATGDVTKAARKAVKDEFAKARESFNAIQTANVPERNKFLKLIHKASDVSKKGFGKFLEDVKYHTTNFAEKSFGEGIEEVGEDVIADLAKQTYQLAGKFGFDTSAKDVGAWDNWQERYLMDFLGGAAGGGLFYGVEAVQNPGAMSRNLDKDFATLIRNGHADELRNQVDQLQKEGKTGASKSLSATEYEIGDDNNLTWKTTDDESKSQSQAVANLVRDKIDGIEEVIVGDRFNLSDDQLFDNMVLSERRFNRYKDIAPLTNYYNDFAQVLDNLIKAEQQLKQAQNTMDGLPNGKPILQDTSLNKLTEQQQQARLANLQEMQEKRDTAKKAVDDFLAGENSVDYVRKMNFAMDDQIHQEFMGLDMENWIQNKYSKPLSQLSPDEFADAAQQWGVYVKEQLPTKLDDAWKKYKEVEKLVNPHLEQVSQEVPQYETWRQNIEKLFTSDEFNPQKQVEKYKGWDDKLDNESDEEFQNRNTITIDKTTGANSQTARAAKIKAYNENLDAEFAAKIDDELKKVGYKVDPITARYIKNILPERIKDKLSREIQLSGLNDKQKAVAYGLTTELNNTQDIKQQILNTEVKQLTSNIENELNAISTIAQNNDELANEGEDSYLTLQEVLDGNAVNLDEDTVKSLNSHIEALLNSGVENIATITLGDLAQGTISAGMFQDAITKQANKNTSFAQSQIDNIVANVKNNPLVKLQEKINTSIKNPITEFIQQVAASAGDTLPNLEKIISTIQDNYNNINDIQQLQLNDAEKSDIEKAINYFHLVKAYIASATTKRLTGMSPVGHNATINDFAKAHADKLRTEWKPLPELRDDYATLFSSELDKYEEEAKRWVKFSDENTANKLKKMARTDAILNKALWDLVSNTDLKVKVGDKEYDLQDGASSVDTSKASTDEVQIPLFEMEKIIHRNFQNALKNSGLSIEEFIKKSNLIQKIIPDISKTARQQSSEINDKIKLDSMSDYDKLVYFATLFSYNPNTFFSKLSARVKSNETIAPITVQEYDTRVAIASTTDTFRQIVKQAYNQSKTNIPFLDNVTIIPGVAGAGKTQVVLKTIDQNFKDKTAFVAGPTTTQALAMQKSMGRDSSITFKELFEKILGKEQYKEIMDDFRKVPEGKSSKYFKVFESPFAINTVELHKDEIHFNKIDNIPSVIYIDEATQLSTAEAEILSEYARQTGAQVFMTGDPAQNGAYNENNNVANIGVGSVWAVRTPQLSVSLRDANLQKTQNQDNVRGLLNEVLEAWNYSTQAEYESLFPKIQAKMSKLNFRIYRNTVLNGDLITKDLDEDTINKIKASLAVKKADGTMPTIAFIGSTSSAHLQRLIEAGINIPKESIMSMKEMQGQEFDYVVIDEKFTKPNSTGPAHQELQKLYTLMTRAREASIFIDNGLSDIIGKNVISTQKTPAPSIKAGIKDLIEAKKRVLNQLTFEQDEEEKEEPAAQKKEDKTPEAPKQEEPQPAQGNGTNDGQDHTKEEIVTADDMADPDTKTIDTDSEKVLHTLGAQADTEEQSNEVIPDTNSAEGWQDYPIESYGKVTVPSVTVLPEEEFTYTVNGVQHKGKRQPWKVEFPKTGVLRNLQAITLEREDGNEYHTYSDKQSLLKDLYATKSAILFGHDWNELPPSVQSQISRKNWEAGKLKLEIRLANDSAKAPWMLDGVINIDEGGKPVPYYVNIVFECKNDEGRICKIDLAGLTDPKTFMENARPDGKLAKSLVAKISNLQNKLKAPDIKPETAERIKKDIAKLQSMSDNLNSAATRYTSWFNDQLTKFRQNGSYDVDLGNVNPEYLTETTWSVHRTVPIRLGGRINPDTIKQPVENDEQVEDATDLDTLIDHNPNMVFSPVYTYSGRDLNDPMFQIDRTLKGKAIIFVTSDTLLKPDQLAQKWLEQIKDPMHHKPVVKMVVLNNYGLSFSQMTNKRFISQMQGSEGGYRRPYRQNFTGIRMFVSLWNARASLVNLLNTYDKWKSENNITDEQMTKLAEADYNIYVSKTEKNKEKASKALEKAVAILQTFGNVDTDNIEENSHYKLFREFTEKTCKDIPMFRIGYNTNINGFHIQRFSLKGTTAYTKPDIDVNLASITLDKARQFKQMLDALINPMVTNEDTHGEKSLSTDTKMYSLHLALMHTDTKTPYLANEYIDINSKSADTRKAVRRSLSGFINDIKGNSGTITIGGEAGKVMYTQGEYWSAVPALISGMVKTIAYYQHNPEIMAVTPDDKLNVACKFYTSDGQGSAVDEHVIKAGLIEFLTGNSGSKPLLSPTKNGIIDNSLFDMLNLIFHGTVEDFHQKKVMQLTDAYFKHGFFINPDLSRQKSSTASTDISTVTAAKEGQIQPTILFFELGTNPALFTSDLDLRTAGIRIPLSKLMEVTTNPATVETTTPQETGPSVGQPKSLADTFKEHYPNIYPALSSYFDDAEDMDDVANSYMTDMKKMLGSSYRNGSADDLMSDTSFITFDVVNNRFITYKEYIATKYNVPIENVKLENGIIKVQIDNEINGLKPGTYSINKNDITVVSKSSFEDTFKQPSEPTEQNTSILRRNFRDSTVGKILEQLVNSKEFKQYSIDENRLTNFVDTINQIVGNTQLPQSEIDKMFNDWVEEYADILEPIAEIDSELFDKLTEC